MRRLLLDQLLVLLLVLLEVFTLKLRVVHLLEVVDELLEESAHLVEVLKVQVRVTDLDYSVEHILLALQGRVAVDIVKGILL